MLTARADSGEQPRGYVGEQNELGPLPRFLQTLEQGIGGRHIHRLGRAEHDDAMAALLGRLGDEGVDLANGVDADLSLALLRRDAQQVRMIARGQHMTAVAMATGGLSRRDAEQAGDQRLGKLLLADPTGAGQQQRMRQAPALILRQEPPPPLALPGQRLGNPFTLLRPELYSHGVTRASRQAARRACTTSRGASASTTAMRSGALEARSR
ncbi:hypothetical protein LOKO_03664 [Halomonas chromatireducens]|uniref:Uncharacterized protein n=1 Tax=Halomonas chromatireducens TaxID=507626 RepID=A0A125R0T7_9GAMM|nr:hypothetical protein LOKO_03664 [Halomonas chromatireducens]